MRKPQQQFASDNYAGICPEAWTAMEMANKGHAYAYGDDAWTKRASDALRATFEHPCDVYFAFNGTAANSLALASLVQPYNSVICSAAAHIETDECGAPQFFSNGAKLLTIPSEDGKLTPDGIRAIATSRADIHFARPTAVSITQPNELGILYSLEEVRAIADTCHELGLKLHMDGSRFGNAVAALGCTAAEASWKAGVDVMCFGGTKAGMAVGEAIVFFDHALSVDFDHRCKQAGQLASKMRFLAAPWIGMLENDAWLKHARHANACARRLADRIATIPGVTLAFPSRVNSVFLKAPEAVVAGLHARGWHFYSFIGGASRLMFAWDADPAEVDHLADDLAAEAAKLAPQSVQIPA